MAGKLKVACKKAMKKTFFIILAAAIFYSCNEDLKVNEQKMDKLDQAGKDLQKTVKQGVDTVASKVKKLKNKLEEKWRMGYELWMMSYELWIMSYELWVMSYE